MYFLNALSESWSVFDFKPQDNLQCHWHSAPYWPCSRITKRWFPHLTRTTVYFSPLQSLWRPLPVQTHRGWWVFSDMSHCINSPVAGQLGALCQKYIPNHSWQQTMRKYRFIAKCFVPSFCSKCRLSGQDLTRILTLVLHTIQNVKITIALTIF